MDTTAQHFKEFFQKACQCDPYGYQYRLACGEKDDPSSTLKKGRACESLLIHIPTGLGKTAAVIMAWLWNRMAHPDAQHRDTWPRRLVYCLPMRTLVDQTHKNTKGWLQELGFTEEVGLHLLMGGEDDGDWHLHPERPTLLIGTQDMLLSRALNRGYGMSRYRWPMHFGLLNSDCLWVLDETQLMGVGVETSAQLDGFRHLAHWAHDKNCPTWWMSATLEEDRLATVDHPKPASGWNKIMLTEAERTAGGIRERYEASKPVAKAEFVLSSATKDEHAKELADLIEQKRVSGLTLVVVNRVSRARKLYAALRNKKLGLDPSRLALIHSRFRPVDREKHETLLYAKDKDGKPIPEMQNRIVVATQAVEAGVDVSARLLITELAPWSSLVQRFGRCNRRGDLNDAAHVIWIDIQPKDDNDDLLLPYSSDDLKKARETIRHLSDAGPQSLAGVHVPETPVIRPVLRRRDLIDLFDTTPDLCGQDLDISRYIRDGEDSDVQFFWRAIPEKSEPTSNEKPPRREELCRVSIGDARKFIEQPKPPRAWQWNSLEDFWQRVDRVRPGAVYLIDVASGGYDDVLGWTGDPTNQPKPYSPTGEDAESNSTDPQTFARYWLSLAEHTQNVVEEMKRVTKTLALEPTITDALHTAAKWHDLGKAHQEFQKAMVFGGYPPDDVKAPYAKSKNSYSVHAMAAERRGFRHELASALAWLSAGPAEATERDLIAYVIAAHHGKVRLSIRALPDEKGDPAHPDRLYARGLWDEDELPPIPDIWTQPVTLHLQLMQMGESEKGPSWLARMIGLRDRLGPFRLAYWETLLRAADLRASREESKRAEKPKET